MYTGAIKKGKGTFTDSREQKLNLSGINPNLRNKRFLLKSQNKCYNFSSPLKHLAGVTKESVPHCHCGGVNDGLKAQGRGEEGNSRTWEL